MKQGDKLKVIRDEYGRRQAFEVTITKVTPTGIVRTDRGYTFRKNHMGNYSCADSAHYSTVSVFIATDEQYQKASVGQHIRVYFKRVKEMLAIEPTLKTLTTLELAYKNLGELIAYIKENKELL